MRILKTAVLLLFALLFLACPSFAKDRQVKVTVQVNLHAPQEAKNVRLWIPYPMSDENQDITNVETSGNYSYIGVFREGKAGNNILYAEWKESIKERTLTYSFNVNRKERVNKKFLKKELSKKSQDFLGAPISKDEFRMYLESTSLGPTGGKVKEYAIKITKGKKTNLAKARAIYDWIVDNMHRDPDVKGCGLGEVDRLLETKGGKCADISSVFVALARASGVPAREIFGIRIPKGKEGDMTKAQHCWAEFYLPGYGWVVVDPADVRKIILEQKLTVQQAKPYREYYFGAVDENRIAFGTGRDIVLNPSQNGQPLNYFMYPYAEADGKVLNEDLFGFNIGYKISFKEL